MENEQDNEYLINTPNIKIKYSLIGTIFWIVLVTFAVCWVVSTLWGFQEIGHFMEKSQYTTKYWVYLQPDTASTKNYRVEADIKRVSEGDGDSSWHAYYLRTVHWNNGGFTDFDDCGLNVKQEQPTYCSDTDDNSYTIRLGEKVKENE